MTGCLGCYTDQNYFNRKLSLPSHSLILLLNTLILNTNVLYGILVFALKNNLVDNTNKYTSIKILIIVHLLLLSIKDTFWLTTITHCLLYVISYLSKCFIPWNILYIKKIVFMCKCSSCCRNIWSSVYHHFVRQMNVVVIEMCAKQCYLFWHILNYWIY